MLGMPDARRGLWIGAATVEGLRCLRAPIPEMNAEMVGAGMKRVSSEHLFEQSVDRESI